MDDSDLPARLERIEARQLDLDKRLGDLGVRLLWLEAKLDVPMSIVDKAMADHFARERRERGARATAQHLAGLQAMAEAEHTGSHKPIDDFVARVKAGEFG
jgi:hypothetical protein